MSTWTFSNLCLGGRGVLQCEKLGTMCQLVETTFDRRKGEELEINVFQNKCCDGRQCTYKKEYLRNGAKVKEWECT